MTLEAERSTTAAVIAHGILLELLVARRLNEAARDEAAVARAAELLRTVIAARLRQPPFDRWRAARIHAELLAQIETTLHTLVTSAEALANEKAKAERR